MNESIVNIPSGWTKVLLSDVYPLEYGRALPERERDPNGKIPVLGSSGIVGWHSKSYAPGPATIVGRKGAAGAVIFTSADFWPIDTTYFVRQRDGIDSKFAYYHLLSLQLNRLEKSTAVPGLSRDDAHSLQILLPPAEEQVRIVAKIEEVFSELDKAVESLSVAREQVKAYRQSVLKYAFEGKSRFAAGKETTSWPMRRLGQLIDFLTSGSRGWAEYYSDHGNVFIRAQNLKHDRLDLSDIAYVQLPKGSTEGVRTKVQIGDVLITITGANVTKTGLVDKDLGTAYVSQHVALCRPTSDLQPEYLYWYLVSEAGGRRQLNEAAYGAGKPGLNLENIRSVEIPLPPLANQNSIVAEIKNLIEKQRYMEVEIDAALARTAALRQTVLKFAFSGRLVAQDLADAPASLLLERISEDKQSDIRTKRGRKSKEVANA